MFKSSNLSIFAMSIALLRFHGRKIQETMNKYVCSSAVLFLSIPAVVSVCLDIYIHATAVLAGCWLCLQCSDSTIRLVAVASGPAPIKQVADAGSALALDLEWRLHSSVHHHSHHTPASSVSCQGAVATSLVTLLLIFTVY